MSESMTETPIAGDRRINARAFGVGSDYRIAGRPLSDNPYPSALSAERKGFRYGWLDVHHSWGLWTRQMGRTVPPLPAVEVGG